MARIYSDITKIIGNTPHFRLNRITKMLQLQVFSSGKQVKQESRNPLGSDKDRIRIVIESVAVAGAFRVASLPDIAGKLIVTIFPYSGKQYLSTDLYEADN